jgi:hypothetical protein
MRVVYHTHPTHTRTYTHINTQQTNLDKYTQHNVRPIVLHSRQLSISMNCAKNFLRIAAINDSATWYSTHTCSTLPRFNHEYGVII